VPHSSTPAEHRHVQDPVEQVLFIALSSPSDANQYEPLYNRRSVRQCTQESLLDRLGDLGRCEWSGPKAGHARRSRKRWRRCGQEWRRSRRRRWARHWWHARNGLGGCWGSRCGQTVAGFQHGISVDHEYDRRQCGERRGITHNARTRCSPTYSTSFAVACCTVRIAGPFTAALLTAGHDLPLHVVIVCPMVWLAAACVLHGTAQFVLGRLR
jgi:hypothetical protein